MKKMNTLFVSVLVALLCVGCMDKPGNMNARPVAEVATVQMQADYDVPVKEGYITVVALDGETLAVTREPMRISVPRRALAPGALEVTYTTEDIYDTFGKSTYWQYLSFEDTRRGDYDYNDLVIHCRIHTDRVRYDSPYYKHTVSVQPVALGSSQKLKLGILYRDMENSGRLTEKILCEDVREELFFGDPTFPINTDPAKEKKQVSKKLTPMLEITDTEQLCKVVWFIETSTDRLYAATTNFDADKTLDMISPDGMPYGISLTSKWNYPVEKCYIGDAYPGFNEWLTSGDETALLNSRLTAKTFPAVKKGSDLIDLWDWEK